MVHIITSRLLLEAEVVVSNRSSGPFFADLSALEKMKEMSGFESVEWDIALSGQNPHAIGVAVKAGSDRENDEREAAFEQRANKSSRNKKKSVKAGFGKSM